MRQLGSKLLAGGLSAGVILLWWPMFFSTDSVTTWLVRGIAWTLAFELLLVALSPLELALWSTGRGERLTRRVEAGGRALLEHHSARRRIGRRAALAVGAVAVPLALIALGVSSHIPSPAAAAPSITRVTRVVRVVRPVRVQRVVDVRTVELPAAAARSSPPTVAAPPTVVAPPPRPAPSQRRGTADRNRKRASSGGSPASSTPAPVTHAVPKPTPQPSGGSGIASGSRGSSPQLKVPLSAPVSGNQTS